MGEEEEASLGWWDIGSLLPELISLSMPTLGVIAGGLVGLIFAVCLVAFMLYRMKKKDEGSYSLEEPKQANGGAYQKPSKQEEFYA